jgi:hypothetical protein
MLATSEVGSDGYLSIMGHARYSVQLANTQVH